MAEDYSAYLVAPSDEDAAARFKQFEHTDPLPDVPPALLNASDIYDYARITGMIWPLEVSETRIQQKLKSASYEIDFLGDIYFADQDGKQQIVKIERDTPFTLPKNSIVFVHLATQFRLPDYIALRFNLRITHVHRGLLLGTGPLIDPGFCGRLLIPLHNLTSKDYKLIGGEGLIWVEFTKLSPNYHWNKNARKSSTDYAHFPADKTGLSPQQYFNKASDGTPAISSIPGEIKTANENAEKAKAAAEAAQTYTRNLTLAAGIALAVSLAGVLGTTWNLISSANKNVADASNTITNFRENQAELKKRTEDIDKQLQALRELLKPSSPTSTLPTQVPPVKSGIQNPRKNQ